MDDRKKSKRQWGPEDYRRVGPVYVRKRLVLLAIIALSATILLIYGLPFQTVKDTENQFPVYRYDAPELVGVSGVVRVLDAAGQVRYVGEVSGGAYTGRGRVFDTAGELVYDGPLVDGVYEGADAKVYQSGVLVYTGEMAGNLYEGQGRRFNPDTGIVSVGQFSEGFLEGLGQEFTGGALLREGTFSRDLLEGKGVEYGENQTLLREGDFSAGLLHGDGREYTASGKLRYEGQFWRGIYHGHGVLYNTELDVRHMEGTFAYGRLTCQGTIYHPSGQLLYTGQVSGERPRADAFLGLSLAEVEAAFTTHWLLYSCEKTTAFVYPRFNLMFITESPVPLVSPAQAEEEASRERREWLDALEQPVQEETGTESTPPDKIEEAENFPEPPKEDREAPIPVEEGVEDNLINVDSVTYAAAPASAEPQYVFYDDELLSPDANKGEIIITQVLSYGQPLPGAAQPESDYISGRHRPGWREWFSDFAAGRTVWNVSVRQSGQFIWRFIPWPSAQTEGDIDELLTEYAGVETMTVRKKSMDQPLWYQTAKWRDGS